MAPHVQQRLQRSSKTRFGGPDISAVAGELIQTAKRQGADLVQHPLDPIQPIGDNSLVRFTRNHRRPYLTPGESMIRSMRMCSNRAKSPARRRT